MTPIPFQNEFEAVFQGDRSLWLKIAGGAAATVFVVIPGALGAIWNGRLSLDLSVATVALLVLATAATGALLAFLLVLKDSVRRRLSRGDPVHPLSQLYFGWGAVSLFAWLVTVVFFVFVGTVCGCF